MKIHALQLHTANLSAVRSFYHELMGLDFQDVTDTQCTFQTGATQLTFKQDAGADGIYHFACNIPCNQIETAKHWLLRREIALIHGFQGEEVIQFPNWHARSVYFFDPVGNIVEFIARDDLRNERPGAFGPPSWLEISEIGIVTPDVATWRSQAAQQYGIGDFDKQPPLPGFAALGDDHGLFIVVTTGRSWLFTTIPATLNPLSVAFENAGGQRFTWQS